MRCFEARAAMPIVLLLWVSVLDGATIDLKNRPVVDFCKESLAENEIPVRRQTCYEATWIENDEIPLVL